MRHACECGNAAANGVGAAQECVEGGWFGHLAAWQERILALLSPLCAPRSWGRVVGKVLCR